MNKVLLIAFGAAAYLYTQNNSAPASDSTDGTDSTSFLDDLGNFMGSAMDSLTAGSDPVSNALAIIKQFEGFSSHAYADPPGQSRTYSIGYGHQIRPGDPYTPASTISRSDAETLLRQDVMGAYDVVIASVTVQLTDSQIAALTSFTYNVGAAAFRSSTLLRKLNAGDVAGAADEFSRWTYANGVVNSALVDRRAQEQALFLTDVSSDGVSA